MVEVIHICLQYTAKECKKEDEIEDEFKEHESEEVEKQPKESKESKKGRKKSNNPIFDEDKIKVIVDDYLSDPCIEKYQNIILECDALMEYAISEFNLRDFATIEKSDLKGELVIKLAQILNNFKKSRGKLFSYLLVCFKNYLNSYLTKATTRKMARLPDGIDFEEEDSYSDFCGYNIEYKENFSDRIKNIPIRNIEYESIQCFQFLKKAWINGDLNKKSECIESISLLFDFSKEKSEFLYNCFMASVRSVYYDSYLDEISYLNLCNLSKHETMLYELSSVFDDKTIEKLIAVFGGMSLNIPSVEDLKQLNKELRIFKEVTMENSIENQEKVCKKYSISRSKLEKIVEKMKTDVSSNTNRKLVFKLKED
jgi:Mor family transcriptional regulator